MSTLLSFPCVLPNDAGPRVFWRPGKTIKVCIYDEFWLRLRFLAHQNLRQKHEARHDWEKQVATHPLLGI